MDLGEELASETTRLLETHRPDVVIHDISGPGMSGYAVAQSIRYGFTDVRRPFMIAVTGHDVSRGHAMTIVKCPLSRSRLIKTCFS